jgi:hypothetical protein
MIATVIGVVLGNLGNILIVVALVAAALEIRRSRNEPAAMPATEILWRDLVFYGVGLSFAYFGTLHAFFQPLVAPSIGWQPSPFEWELAWAEYGVALIAILSRGRGAEMRLAATLVFAVFSFGAAAQHIEQIACCQNFAPGNAGTILWIGDIALPLALLILAYLSCKRSS